MRTLGFLFACVVTFSAWSQSNFDRLSKLTDLKRISFGSCNNQGDDQPLWNDLLKQKPDLWIWGGDNVYVDWMPGRNIRNAYEFQNKHPLYAQFKKQTPIIGTWDDHDYAFDNADGHFENKLTSQSLALDFLEIPKESFLREQEGIYTSYEFGSEDKKIKVILLDNRYFKDMDPEYPMLGKTQWIWLEHELKTSTAKLNFIVTGLPVLSPLVPYTEEWGQGKDLNRMLEVLRRTQPQGVVFLTGDKHFSSIYQRYGHLEFMSSGMTHVADRRTWPILRRKFPNTYFGLSYGQIDIEWDHESPIITMSQRTTSGKDVNKSKFKWNKTKWEGI